MSDLPERVHVTAGQTIFAKGDPGDRAYLLLNGRIALSGATSADLRIREAGDVFGVSALIDGSAREVTATAVADCDLLGFSADQLGPAVSQLDPMLRLAIGSIVSRHSEARAARRASGADPHAGILPLWTDGIASARHLVMVEHELRAGLEKGELELFFQPIVRFSTGGLAGYEALVRWRHPSRGMLLPGDFIPLAEAAGLIGVVTSFCLSEVGRRFPALRAAAQGRAGGEPLFVSVNVSASDLAQSAFAAQAVMLLGEGGVEPEEVRLEITESVLMTDIERCIRTMRNCSDQGFGLAIDDFGTGYSSLHMLSALPVSVLKMDRSFCATAQGSEAGRKVIAAILRLGHELGLQVVAEGVETRQQAELLAALSCDFGQGFLFGGALDHAAAHAFAAGRHDVVVPAA